MRVKVNSLYRYNPCAWDMFHMFRPCDGNTLQTGQIVRVINRHDGPKANTMGQCYVAEPQTGKFICMLATSSLDTLTPEQKRFYNRFRDKRRSQNAPIVPIYMAQTGLCISIDQTETL